MTAESSSLVTLLTDFGTDDPWVGSLKSVIWQISPGARIVDVTHSVPAHDVFAGAFALYRCYRDYPEGTVHLCVVDPGVGGARRPILVATAGRFFVGPDNGLFSFIYEFDTVRQVVHLTCDRYFHLPVSGTFHGRDIFAPVAAWLASGVAPSEFGPSVGDGVKLAVPVDRIAGDNLVRGEVCAVDRFGNCITNIRAATLDQFAERTGRRRFKVLVGGQEIPLAPAGGYGQDAPVFALMGSSGLLELASNRRSAAQVLGLTGRGKEVGVMGA